VEAWPPAPQGRRPATDQIHAGTAQQLPAHPVRPPLYLSAAYEFGTLAQARETFAQRQAGYTYSRTGNPTVALFERRIAALEAGVGAVATSSGQAAITLVVLALAGRSGQSPDGEPHSAVSAGHVVASNRIYGGTADLLNDTLAEAGITVTWVDPHSPAGWEAAITDRTRLFLVESVGNPHGDLADIPALADVANRHGIVLTVDNTLATPYLVQPGTLGAHLVVHSATKYLLGNGSCLGGAIVATGQFKPSEDPERWPQLAAPRTRFGGRSLVAGFGDDGALLHLIRAQLLNDTGPTLSAYNAQQILDGIETLDVRVQRHCANTEELARRLAAHPAVSIVRHPSLPDSRDHRIAQRDYPHGTGGILSFEIDTDITGVEYFFTSLNLFKIAANLGDSRSMAVHPASTTHCRLTEALAQAGQITERTIRLAVGREDLEDLWADLDTALHASLTANASGGQAQKVSVS
jgi:O-acetylhomoserine (thiol)-lyase